MIYNITGLHPKKLEVICKTDVWRQTFIYILYFICYILCINILYFNIINNLNYIKLFVLYSDCCKFVYTLPFNDMLHAAHACEMWLPDGGYDG
jgi:hypothetical protein